MERALRRFGEALLELLFPPRCVACRRDGALLCQGCLEGATRIGSPFCSLCSRPSEAPLCYRCRQEPLTHLQGIRSLFLLEGPIREAIYAFKYRGLSALATPLGALLAQYLRGNPIPGDVLVPVPLHPRRLKERGYNQATLLVREVGRVTGLPILEGAVVRVRYTHPQTHTANMQERYNNVLRAFEWVSQDILGQNVILIDDVCTTGATLQDCARALKEGGARSVWGLTLAREA